MWLDHFTLPSARNTHVRFQIPQLISLAQGQERGWPVFFWGQKVPKIGTTGDSLERVVLVAGGAKGNPWLCRYMGLSLSYCGWSDTYFNFRGLQRRDFCRGTSLWLWKKIEYFLNKGKYPPPPTSQNSTKLLLWNSWGISGALVWLLGICWRFPLDFSDWGSWLLKGILFALRDRSDWTFWRLREHRFSVRVIGPVSEKRGLSALFFSSWLRERAVPAQVSSRIQPWTKLGLRRSSSVAPCWPGPQEEAFTSRQGASVWSGGV